MELGDLLQKDYRFKVLIYSESKLADLSYCFSIGFSSSGISNHWTNISSHQTSVTSSLGSVPSKATSSCLRDDPTSCDWHFSQLNGPRQGLQTENLAGEFVKGNTGHVEVFAGTE